MRRRTGFKGLAKSIVVLVGLGLTVGVVGAYAGIEPFVSYGEVVKGQAVSLTSQYMQSDEPAYPRERQFSGTYTTFVPLLNMEQRLVFQGDTLTIVSDLAGTSVYRYTATMESESEGVLRTTHVPSQKVSEMYFEYVGGADCLVMYSKKGEEGVTYCK